uniref:Uncharacterized protein n=1 Tax=Triticum urartu TaxID=4572 RepID=A0A8R7R9F9_TRIUA
MMNKYIGSDVMSVITLLIIIFEPLGKWQRWTMPLSFPLYHAGTSRPQEEHKTF